MDYLASVLRERYEIMNRMYSAVWYAILFVFLVTLPLYASNYWLYVLSLTMVYGIAALGLNVISGYAGQMSLAQAAYLGIGAYASAFFTSSFQLPFLLTLLVSGLIAGILGLVLAFPSVRVRGLYLAITTLAVGVVFQRVVGQIDMLGGQSGLSVSRPSIGSISFQSDFLYFYCVLTLFIISILIMYCLLRGKFLRALLAIRDNEVAAEAIGISLIFYKTLSFAVCGFYAGIAGSLYAYLIGYIGIEDFGLTQSIDFFAMIVIGGMASIPGSLLGAAFVTILPEILRGIAEYQPAVFGILMILVVFFLPKGMVGVSDKILQIIGGMKKSNWSFPKSRSDQIDKEG